MMVEERWVMCGEFFLFLAEDLGEITAGKIIQEGCAYGTIFARAKKARFVLGGRIEARRNWPIPAVFWLPSPSVRLQGGPKKHTFTPELGSLHADGFKASDIGIGGGESVLAIDSEISIYLDGIQINEEDAMELGYRKLSDPLSSISETVAQHSGGMAKFNNEVAARAWANEAAGRFIPIQGCEKDAEKSLGESRPTRAECRILLKEARAQLHIPTKQGRSPRRNT